jgi:acetaldehyde dehydrogenase (acetylating)
MKASAAIVGSGNTASDLLDKLRRSEHVEPRWAVAAEDVAGSARSRVALPGRGR